RPGLLERRGEVALPVVLEVVARLPDADARALVVGARVAVRVEEVEVAVEVEVRELATPLRDADGELREPRADRRVAERRDAVLRAARDEVVQVERVRLELPVRHEQVLVAVAVDVARGEAHAPARVVEAGGERDVLERAALVAPETVRRLVVRDVEV